MKVRLLLDASVDSAWLLGLLEETQTVSVLAHPTAEVAFDGISSSRLQECLPFFVERQGGAGRSQQAD